MMPHSPPRRRDIHTSLPPEVCDKLTLFAKREHIAMSAVFEEAITRLLHEQDPDTRDMHYTVQKCARVLTALMRDVAYLTEITGMQYELLMAQLPELAPSEIEGAKQRRNKRMAQTVKTLQHRLRTNTRRWDTPPATGGADGQH